ncbi:hypothetical protein BJ742DRAFT_852352 [Cladochytrium replicatum]|nr:hypothetical protein BJ742DRAFT_852352 [Cladochytrium replicatum]
MHEGSRCTRRSASVLGFLFFIIMIFYAGFRGQRIVTQLPATFRTSTPPNSLPLDFLNQLFPSRVPAASYEFPAVTFCPTDTAEDALTLVSCKVLNTSQTAPGASCPGVFSARTYAVNGVVRKGCVTVNNPQPVTRVNADGEPETDLPGQSSANSVNDYLEVQLQTASSSSAGIVAVAHPTFLNVDGVLLSLPVSFDNAFSAPVNARVMISARKVYSISRAGVVSVLYETFPFSTRSLVNLTNIINNATLSGGIDQNTTNNSVIVQQISQNVRQLLLSQTAGRNVVVQIKYPKLEVTYEKSFLTLDMNNWLGEVGGVAALLYFLHSAFCFIVRYGLTQSSTHSETAFQKFSRNEGFN